MPNPVNAKLKNGTATTHQRSPSPMPKAAIERPARAGSQYHRPETSAFRWLSRFT